jgi:hypothetical protein
MSLIFASTTLGLRDEPDATGVLGLVAENMKFFFVVIGLLAG